ncbi:ribonuclease H-like domain-containing protein [Halostella pelagica]|uniref:ribonuclease H-like domain-containing protein n=1 Tax=Halostella pelagica TaxID=2583824 RepID=UPI0010819A21|nr:ribonuclease H-like domain-containing protein [Halostella pelagica]
MASPPPRVTVLSSDLVTRCRAAQVRDALRYADPDALLLSDPGALVRLRAATPDLVEEFGPLLVPGDANRGDPAHHRIRGVDLVVPTTDEGLAEIEALESAGTVEPSTETYVISDRLDVSVRPTSLEATLSGVTTYRESLAPDALGGSYTHVSTAAPVDYYREWDGLTAAGAGPDADSVATGTGRGGAEIPTLQFHSDGTVCSTAIATTRLGLRALSGVGETTAGRLREAGYADPEAVAEAQPADLLDVSGVGRESAETICDHARALEAGEVVRYGDEYVPDREPVFIDIETDGLTPTVVWLIGVLDREGEETYMSFLNRDPDDPGRAVEAFVSWYAANARGRPVVAYNGLSFDFPTIADHVERHCPEHLDDWESTYTFDPYYWAVRQDNAVFPGRTNKLGDVAAALGWETDDTGLTGAAVGRAYRQWMRERTAEAEPDWERHERYCEDDVRSLAFVYDALTAASGSSQQRTSSSHSGSATGDDTSQGTLTDF